MLFAKHSQSDKVLSIDFSDENMFKREHDQQNISNFVLNHVIVITGDSFDFADENAFKRKHDQQKISSFVLNHIVIAMVFFFLAYYCHPSYV